MGLLDGMLTVLTTIGRVAGALAGADGKVLDLGPLGTGSYPNLGQVVFFRKGGQIQAFNQSATDSVMLFFPGNATLAHAPTQLPIAPTKTLDVSLALVDFAEAGIDDFTLVPLPDVNVDFVPITDVNVDGDGPETNIQAQANQPISPGVEVKIGPYFTVKLNAPERTIVVGVVGSLSLAAIVLLNVRGAGTTVVRIANALRKTGVTEREDDPQHITVDLPTGIDLTGGLTEVDISASVVGLATLAAEFARENAHLFRTLTDEDHARIAAHDAALRRP